MKLDLKELVAFFFVLELPVVDTGDFKCFYTESIRKRRSMDDRHTPQCSMGHGKCKYWKAVLVWVIALRVNHGARIVDYGS
jgi:hypothetical protein